ncbi:hypothetical protein [Usitatibacter palustris]|uniref:Uncharacterized protein n=1 Tax=Usitatibacter palustris TaxID=2732487 RepID=A0A6M4H6H2_9PROT|nr:hypothetical protein [Usitatibacter palustris]QJR13547.1 hypothetical protein DSM104440_00331 [Usitatibacter palustris]
MLPKRIEGFLNTGDTVIADILAEGGTRCFVRIRPVPNPSVPREERRYLNSRWSMWEYWWYDFRRMELRPGWEELSDDYDMFLVTDEAIRTKSEVEFYVALRKWVPPTVELQHFWDSACPE